MSKLEYVARMRDIKAHTLLNLVENIDKWGLDRNITREGGATAQMQVSKMIEELAETVATMDSINTIKSNVYYSCNSSEFWDEAKELEVELDKLQQQLEDDYGDMLVCLIQAMRLSGTNITNCLQKAWDDIKDRKGTMIDGKFVKESDSPTDVEDTSVSKMAILSWHLTE